MKPRATKKSAGELVEQQVRLWEVERQRRPRGPEQTLPPRPIVTLSRALGAEGEAIATGLARLTGFQLLDRELLDAMAADLKVQIRLLEPLDEATRSETETWVLGVLDGRVLHKSDYLKALTRVLATVRAHGQSIVIGRGAGQILGAKDAFRARITRSRQGRIDRIAWVRGISSKDAEKLIEQNDRRQAEFIQEAFGCHIEDPTRYDLVINTDELATADCVELALLGYSKKERSADRRR